ncbi:protein phosphatase 2c, putative [Ichthyophthirius multifiliis]|uniref:protein-serine/threonine phosphatase n=1 Tax=Ichthyophthirius multifiliis TaxID=5932 RepID=G0R3N8_ICHMU|nr:protein phosphatase 2c, putative [Ichthyophthirius multifiliis]EGR27921.1 protein phosphatase 2c, putative [Ichthyophthirius multifiliis]|eukprot:XP_004027266.1 protein phosphatase 2c, putative [Ichthyophthirius multifiliis]
MGIYLAQPITTKKVVNGQNQRLEFCAASMQGWRAQMEDAHISCLDFDGEGKHIFGVFDGHGGKVVAEFVEKYFIKQLVENQSYKNGQYVQALEETFLCMDQLITSPLGREELQNTNAGCTANVCLIVNNKLYCANSGDSRSVICVGGKAVELSEDHKPENQIEKQRIHKAGGEIYNGRVNGNLNLSRALGDMEYKRNLADENNKDPKSFLISAFPDVKEFEINTDANLIVLGCDGIWECKTNQQIVEYFNDKSQVLQNQVEQFLDSILAPCTQGNMVGLDNMSIIVVRIKH